MRPVVVLLNGIPGSGKSTIARAWCGRRATRLALALDIDVLRSMLPDWHASPIDAGLAARAMAVAAIRVHLAAGRDVLVPQYVPDPRFIDELEEVARSSGAAFIECALVIDHLTAQDRCTARTTAVRACGGDGVEGDLERPMTVIHDEFERFVADRPAVVRLAADGPGPVDELDRIIAGVRGRADGPEHRAP